MPSKAVRTYRYRIVFDAPLPFVFRWCTDYRPEDSKLEGESYTRKILERGKDRVVFEDLEWTATGWFWKRNTVELHRPDRWHSDSVGNYREFDLDYRLRALSPERTELTFVGRRTPVGVGRANPSFKEFGRDMDSGWGRFKRHLERDYRRTGSRRRRAA